MKKLIFVSLLFISQFGLLTSAYAINHGNTKVVGMDRSEYTYFGESVAIFGDYAIVGSPEESFIDSDDFMNNRYSAGAAYLYKYTKGTDKWELVTQISPKINYASFGKSVAIDGNRIVIGAFDQDVNGDGSGANHGAVYIYENYTQGIGEPIMLSPSQEGTYFGRSVAISNDQIVVGATWGHTEAGVAGGNYGAAYIYSNKTGEWILQQQIISPELDTMFGQSVSIYDNYLVVGSQARSATIKGAGYAYYYNSDSESWVENGSFPIDGREGVNIVNKVLVSNSFLFITAYLDKQGSYKVGSVSVYKRNISGTSWVFAQKISPLTVLSNGDFGVDISISDDEKTLAIGASGANKVFFYSQAHAEWSVNNSVNIFGNGTGLGFGRSVATTNSSLVVGVPNHSYDVNGENYESSAGAAYFFGSMKSSPALIYYLLQ